VAVYVNPTHTDMVSGQDTLSLSFLIEGQQTKFYPDAVQHNTLILYHTLLHV